MSQQYGIAGRRVIPTRSATLATLACLGCIGPELVTGTTLEAGTYTASTFLITPAGQPQIDVLAAGGSLTIVIAQDGSTTGALHVPGSVAGGADFNASMAGTADIAGLTVEFDQAADTFVRDLVWSRIEGALVVAEQTVGGATYNISLDRLGN